MIREERQHRYIEIRESDREHKLITLIEILSPSISAAVLTASRTSRNNKKIRFIREVRAALK